MKLVKKKIMTMQGRRFNIVLYRVFTNSRSENGWQIRGVGWLAFRANDSETANNFRDRLVFSVSSKRKVYTLARVVREIPEFKATKLNTRTEREFSEETRRKRNMSVEKERERNTSQYIRIPYHPPLCTV